MRNFGRVFCDIKPKHIALTWFDRRFRNHSMQPVEVLKYIEDKDYTYR